MTGMAGKRKYEEDFIICVSVIAKCGKSNKKICNNRILEYSTECTWDDVYHDIINDTDFRPHKADVLNVSLSDKLDGTMTFHPDLHEGLHVVKEFNQRLKYVTFTVTRDESVGLDDVSSTTTSTENQQAPPARTAFSVLMSTSVATKLPQLKDTNAERFTAKDELFNGIVKDMIECGDKFPGSMSHQIISEQVLVLVNALWYISGNMSTIEERAAHLTRIKHIPERFLKFDGANDYKRKKQKRPQLTAKDLKLHVQCLFRLISRPFTQHWTLRGDIETLTGCLQSYADYLEKANEKQISRQLQMNPVRQIDSNLSIAHRPRQDEILPCYSRLDGQVSQMAMFQPLFFDEDLHLNEPFKGPEQRFRYFEKLCLTIPVHMLRYDPGGGIGAISFIWRIPEDGMSSSEMFMRDNQVLHSLRSKLPEYHTRQMRQEFFNAYGNIAGTIIPPHILRSIYTTFTNDASADQNKEIDNRVRLSVLGIDPDLVVDLRHLNKGRPNNTFDVFFQTLEKEIQDMVAADERRHNTEHISRFLSVRDMIEQVKSKVPEGTNIPSESSVLLAFLYKGRVPIRLKVQTRQLRAQHQDDHYCSALFKYCRAYATQFRDISNFVCMDDKSKLDFGEPDLFTSTGVRGKKSIVPMNSVLSCLDHDVQSKGSLTPSVVLDVDIPGDATETFYRGQVSVTFKDSIFQASTPFRHIVELETILKAKNENKPALFMYTDGGPDHRVTYGAVKLSLIVLFRRLQLEFLVACRTAPGHSWTNPAERIMSLLNIAFQNTALAREHASSDVETILKTCGSMNEIRKKAGKNNQIKTEWLQSVQPMIKTLTSRTERVQLKEKSFKVFKAAEDADVEMAEAEVTLIDPAIKVGKYQQQQLSHATQLKKFIADHCRERHYSFQIRRCHDEGCCPTPEREWAWLPDPILDINGQHYKPFDELLGKETTDKDRPSSLKQTVAAVAQEQQGCKNSILVGQNVRQTVNCCECLKPRCIYAKTKLTARDQRALTHTLEKYDYTCGSVITPDGDILQGKVFVRLQLSCAVHIEFPYYASNIGRPDICAHCGVVGAEKSQEMTGRFRTVLPVCQQCLASGKDIPKRNPVKN
ncbi:hypothetical protein ACJMK2_033399 [Sinanodonta woodiana]|uniref:Uncharacterized protein n=1 Tax=Sinanodonta woodiana TaxID=1069815 RepID=A0ABD3WRT3_SINWO